MPRGIVGVRARWLWIFLLSVFLAGFAAVLVGYRRLAPAHDNPSSNHRTRRWTNDRLPIDDSGYDLMRARFVGKYDPTSLESIRQAFDRPGYRGIEILRGQRLATDVEELNRMVMIATLHGYEGDFAQASATLQEARERAERDPARFARGLPTLVFLQGVMALRRGEVENCVECACQGSCIFPLQPSAFHRKRDGSRQAIRYFTEYLKNRPNDAGVRWLLNVAYMTLGKYPDGVPARYRMALPTVPAGQDLGKFEDAAARLGVNRLHQSGGAIMDDFDNDGLLDILETSSSPADPIALFRNRGDGTFANVASKAGLETQLGGLYCVQTDYDNDGWLDVFICRGAWLGPQRPSLLHNNRDGTFTDVTRKAGLIEPINSQVAVWADYDNDGWLDLFVGGETVPSRLYHNRGDGTFEEVAGKAGVSNKGHGCKGASWGDHDGDGYPDLFVNNLNGPPRLFHNNGDGTFTDVASELGITQPQEGFSCWFWDYDNDGWLDLFATGYERDLSTLVSPPSASPGPTTCRLYRNRKGKGFEDVTQAVGLNLPLAPMGSNFADLDGDGYLDFYLATGTPAYSALVPNRLFRNVGGKRFVDVTVTSGTGHLQKGHAVACGDWDRNGSIDLFVQMGGAAPGDRARSAFFQNPGHGEHWLTVRLVGKKTNRAAIGARIKVTAAPTGQTIYRHVTSGSSFGANTLQQTIGIGKANRIAALEVYWPTSGTKQVFHDVAVDQAIEITEFAAAPRPLKWAPLSRTKSAKTE
jgi:hypothetical protein